MHLDFLNHPHITHHSTYGRMEPCIEHFSRGMVGFWERRARRMHSGVERHGHLLYCSLSMHANHAMLAMFPSHPVGQTNKTTLVKGVGEGKELALRPD